MPKGAIGGTLGTAGGSFGMIGVSQLGASDYEADWSSAWGPEWTRVSSATTAGTLSVSGGNGVVTGGSGGGIATVARLDTPPFGDFEALVGIGTRTSRSLFGFRWGGSMGPTYLYDGYMITAIGVTGGLALYRMDAGVNTRLDPSTNVNPVTPAWLRIQATGSTIRYRWWSKSVGEPATWTASVVDATYASGHFGLGSHVGSTAFTDCEIAPL